MEKFTRILGTTAVVIGSLSAVLTTLFLLKPTRFFVFSALFCGLLGFISSNIYIFMNLRYRVNEKKVTPGTLGILLSSAPVLLILIIKVIHKS
jgi:uncharacterized membrane protein YdbT with pleckstrin-like domain